MTLNCFVVDDEPDALEISGKYIGKTPGLKLIGTETDPFLAFNKLDSGQVKADILFLDINMPGFKGTDFAWKIRNKTNIVFTTAHRGYGSEAYNIGALDYLVKPYPYERFMEAISKAMAYLHIYPEDPASLLYIPGNGKGTRIKVHKEQILYVQGFSNYSQIFLDGKHYFTYFLIKNMVQLLGEDFCRIHKSFIVRLDRIHKYDSHMAELENGIQVPVGRTYKNAFFDRMLGKNL